MVEMGVREHIAVGEVARSRPSQSAPQSTNADVSES
jgi:hypothetical protein